MQKRLQYLIGYYGFTSSRFAETVGIQPSAVSHLISGRNKPGFDIIAKILTRFPKVNPRWLILGEEPMVLQSSTSSGDLPDTSGIRDSLSDSPSGEPEITPPTSPGELYLPLDFTGTTTSNNEANPEIPGGIIGGPEPPVPGSANKPTDGKPHIVKVLVLYSDGTFDSFNNK